MKQIVLTIATTDGESAVDAYVPFEESNFAVHRLKTAWGISHVPTGYRVPGAYGKTRNAAVELAARLHKECPAAAKVKRGNLPSEGEVRVKSRGPHAQLASEVKAVLGLGFAA